MLKHAAMLRWDVLFKHEQLLWQLLRRNDGRVRWDEQRNEQQLNEPRLDDNRVFFLFQHHHDHNWHLHNFHFLHVVVVVGGC